MKKRITLILSTALLLAAVAWSASVYSNEAVSNNISEPLMDSETSQVKKMERRQKEITSRVGMSAPMEAPEEGELDVVAMAYEQGWIIEATLEEVEGALKAAAATPSTEDDVEAMTLAHRGSYRYFLNGDKPEPPVAEANPGNAE